MNPPSLLQIVERLEGLAGKLPSRIRKAVLSELTPLKQLFLQQRPPRFLFTGLSKMPIGQIIRALFAPGDFTQTRDLPVRMPVTLMIRLPFKSMTNSNFNPPMPFFSSRKNKRHVSLRSESLMT